MISKVLHAQNDPVFDTCKGVENPLKCFKEQVQQAFFENFKLPIGTNSTENQLVIFFEVTKKGAFNVLNCNNENEKLRLAVSEAFDQFPVVQPVRINAKKVTSQYTLRINLFSKVEKEIGQPIIKPTDEYSNIVNAKNGEKELFKSYLNIPFSHLNYAKFEGYMNHIGTNSHTASKPFMYHTVLNYYNFEKEQKANFFKKKSWFGTKFWNEHLVSFKGSNYWFTGDIVADLQLGKDFNSSIDYTYNNTRAFNVQGGIGKRVNFFSTLYESQGRFADYINQYAMSIKPDGGNPGTIPGRGIAKRFKKDAFDYPLAEGYISFNLSESFNAQFGHGKNFIGDGYRSLFLSDVSSPSPYLKINTNFWKINYTNTWLWLKDIRPSATVNGAFSTKYMATHFLSWNATKRLNIGFFESVIWENTNKRGFDVNYLNPIIFYRAIEFSTGSRAGNALIGLSSKYKFTNSLLAYNQFIVDEFSSKDIFGKSKSWKNKLGYQIGIKYQNAFKINDLLVQAEYNQVRPYTYSHDELLLNYGHNNQSMAHLWGANFRELIVTAYYHKQRWYGMSKFVLGERGLDKGDGLSYGGNIFSDNDLRPSDVNVKLVHGNGEKVFLGDLQIGYLVNPSTNLKTFLNLTYRNVGQKESTWLNFGFRTDLFNWYNDF